MLRRWAPWLVVGSTAAGCSLLYELDVAQCSSTADCRAKGAAFAETECVASLCVSATGTGGSSGTGGGNTGGGGGAPECATHMECVEANFGIPHLCREGACQRLTLPGQCPGVLGLGADNENLKKPDPIVVGLYSYVPADAGWRQSVPTLNYELAINEFNDESNGGLPGGRNNTRRPILGVVCSGTNGPDLDASLKHLVEDLEVPAILSSLYSTELLPAFETWGKPNDVFFLSPLEANSSLVNAMDNGLMWHMLTSARELAPAYLPLLARAETYVRQQLALPPEEEIRVALVESNARFLRDIGDYLVANMVFNGKSQADNLSAGNFLRVRVDSAIEAANVTTTKDFADRVADVRNFKPHIVLAIASSEFVVFRGGIENRLPDAPEPFYLASPYLFGISSFASQGSATWPRTLGVNFAGAENKTLYNLYLSNLKAEYTNFTNLTLDGSENFYDAAYFLMYSIAGAGNPPRLTGREVAAGMTRLVTGSQGFNVGRADVADALAALSVSNSRIALRGTMGPPDFDTSTGVRHGLPSIYCLEAGNFVQDAMTYNPDTQQLEGAPSCVPDF
jgi:hypothetical protein